MTRIGIEAVSMKRFTLYGSPHSLPTYRVALMLRLSGAPFSFRYVSYQKKMHKTPEFLALSRWGQVPVLLDDDRVHLQSAAIIEHLAETLGRFQGPDPVARQHVREWMYWSADVLFPPIFNCYGVQLGQRNLLPISVDPVIAGYHRERAEAALSVLDSNLAGRDYLCAAQPTIADLSCRADVAFAEICEFDLSRWSNLALWATRIAALPGFQAPFDLLAMEDAEFT
jgi:glutathione S-transferase